MLRASAGHHDEKLNLLGVGDEHVDVGLPGGRALSALTEAAVLRDSPEMERARSQAITSIGVDATRRAIQVAGNFEMMNRLLDAVGVGPPVGLLDMGGDIGVPCPDRHR